jgi:hypothetical protein
MFLAHFMGGFVASLINLTTFRTLASTYLIILSTSSSFRRLKMKELIKQH